jgi:hypothetical protein
MQVAGQAEVGGCQYAHLETSPLNRGGPASAALPPVRAKRRASGLSPFGSQFGSQSSVVLHRLGARWAAELQLDQRVTTRVRRFPPLESAGMTGACKAPSPKCAPKLEIDGANAQVTAGLRDPL